MLDIRLPLSYDEVEESEVGSSVVIKKISRQEYKAMLDRGLKFRNWSLYEPDHRPHATYYIVVDDKGQSILNKTEQQP